MKNDTNINLIVSYWRPLSLQAST